MPKTIELEQGSDEWHEYRKTRIGASDTPIILGQNPWTTCYQLWQQKLGLLPPTQENAHMKRGKELEEEARNIVNRLTGFNFKPVVLEHDKYPWMFASYDGIDFENQTILEIKCPFQKSHDKIPSYYLPQLMKQQYVSGFKKTLYYSYVKISEHDYFGKLIQAPQFVNFDDLIQKEKKFNDCMVNFEPPELVEKDYVDLHQNEEWIKHAETWKYAIEKRKYFEKMEEESRKKLIEMSLNKNSKGCGIKILKTIRKGSVIYDNIPELKLIDKEKYRNPPITTWRIYSE